MPDSLPDIGGSIRRRRQARGLTLESLAGTAGVSVTMLSEVERSVKNPTVRLAWQIARGLGCSLTELIEEPGPPGPRIVRAGERSRLVDPETGVERCGVSTELQRRGLEVATYLLPPGSGSGAMSPNRPGVLEHIVVQAGTLTLRVGDETEVLGPGDHVTYGPQAEVEYRNETDEACEFLLLSDSLDAGY